MTDVTIESIRALGAKSYLVTLVTQDQRARSFIFTVDDSSPMPLIMWPDEFTDSMRLNLGPARPIFNAIHAVHAAATQAIDIELYPRPRDVDAANEKP
jgi:hypothetical protein